MRIVSICGIWSGLFKASMWNNMEEAFREQFPKAIFTRESLRYSPWEVQKIISYARDITERNDDGTDLLFVGHSMGGVIACAVAAHCVKSKVKAVVTVFSPHKLLGSYYTRQIVGNLSLPVSTPLITFQARFDHLVPFESSTHPCSKFHLKLNSDHLLSLIVLKRHWRTIAFYTRCNM